jgi:hypothetical protein
MICLDALDQGLRERVGAHVAQHMDLDALGPRLGDRVRPAILHVDADGIDLEERAPAKSRTGERKLGIGHARPVVDFYAGNLCRRRGVGKAEEKEQPKNHTPRRSR